MIEQFNCIGYKVFTCQISYLCRATSQYNRGESERGHNGKSNTTSVYTKNNEILLITHFKISFILHLY